MNLLQIQLKKEQAALMYLVPDQGPTSMAFAFTNIKILLLEISQSEATDSVHFQTWATLDTTSMVEFDAMLDYFGTGQFNHYQASFVRLKHLINTELDKLWLSLSQNSH